MGDSSQTWEPGAHCTACRQLNRLESVLFRCTSQQPEHLPGSSADLCFFWVTGLVWEWLLAGIFACIFLGREGLFYLLSFELSFPKLNQLLCRMGCFTSLQSISILQDGQFSFSSLCFLVNICCSWWKAVCLNQNLFSVHTRGIF